jgi:hypothetical protein
LCHPQQQQLAHSPDFKLCADLVGYTNMFASVYATARLLGQVPDGPEQVALGMWHAGAAIVLVCVGAGGAAAAALLQMLQAGRKETRSNCQYVSQSGFEIF